jgi:ABC-2 type transport system ATP-binding protein
MTQAIPDVSPGTATAATRADRLISSGSPSAIRTDGLTKDFGRTRVVDGLDIDIPPGVVAAFVGPNGSGKTTTLRMLLGLIAPTAGTAQVLGCSISRPAAYLPRVGALIEGPAFYHALTGRRNLDVLAALGGLPRERVPKLLDQVGLGERGDDLVTSYSLGMKQRLGIATALLPDPALLILDEPANGLDPAGIREMRALLRSLADDGRTVFVSSHLLAEVEEMADWLVVIKQGRLLFSGPMAQAIAAQKNTLIVGAEHDADLPRVAEVATAAGYAVEFDGNLLRIAAQRSFAAELNRRVMALGISLAELHVGHASLEETFLAMTEGAEE